MAELRILRMGYPRVTSINPTKTTVYTVPTGKRVILKNISARSLLSAGGQNLYVFIDNTLVQSRLFGGSGTNDIGWTWNTWIVMNEGSVLSMAVSNVAGVDVAASGSIHYT